MSAALPFHAIIVAAGRGARSGYTQPKQFMLLAGKPVLRWSVEAFAGHPLCRSVTIVAPPDPALIAQTQAIVHGLQCHIAPGGQTRQQSVAAGLTAPLNDDVPVLIHDAARPGLTHAVIDRLLAALADAENAGAIPVLPVADTLVRADDGAGGNMGANVAREGLYHVQTPQAFRRAAILAAHGADQTGRDASDDAQLVRAMGGVVALVEGERRLGKITYAQDLDDMERMIAPAVSARAFRTATATGFDVHRLIAGDGLWLGGIRIAHDRMLEGHSDADVLLHAITDALLGTIAEGDIGSHFPPSDPQWKGAASDRFLAHAAELIARRGAEIEHVDCTIICEAPKVGPHRAAIRARIAEILGLELDRVSVKATTSERLGFTGRGEGIAAQAAATVLIPLKAASGEDNQHA